MQSAPASTHIVLVGGGHAHVIALKSFGMKPEPGVVLTLITREIEAPYSGMLPGFVAGHYTYDQCHIDVVRLAAWAGARMIQGTVIGIDRKARRVEIDGRPPLAYDLLSIDVGITPRLEGIDGADAHGLAVKPVSTFAARWRALARAALAADGPRRIAVIGSGAAGFELVLAIRHYLRMQAPAAGIDPDAFSFALVGGSVLLPSHSAWARALARREIAAQGVTLIENDRVVQVVPGTVHLASGRTLAADATLFATHAGPAEWFRTSGLPCDDAGFIAVRPTLQILDDDDIFAVGDCAAVLKHPREKAGVFAVRQGPPLTENLRLRARGMAAKPFTPQRHFLTLLATGRRHAIAARNGLAFAGDLLWRWKDRIDRTFMDRFNVLPPMVGASEDEMRCAGCAAKIGPVTLAAALDRLQDRGAPARDDAAIIDEGGAELRVETVDFFRAFWPEPYVFGEIAANHAMNDVFAMGAIPTHALANVVLPYASSQRVAEDLYQLLAGARAAFEREGVEIVGGHSSEGTELAAGFFVSGKVERGAVLGKRGLRPGDRLILTRPLGTGILFAALMRGRARAPAIAGVLDSMRQSSGDIARLIRTWKPRAATDVTGFGLAGHLLEMLKAGAMVAELDLSRVPLYGSVMALARDGVASSLLPENSRLASALVGDRASDAHVRTILFDPQTAGGFLFGVAADNAEACVDALRQAGARHAAIIGTVLGAYGGGEGWLRLTGALAEDSSG
ncbi:MAG: selenide, water dikinase SelD [Hyphomicrobiaceae bacterium]